MSGPGQRDAEATHRNDRFWLLLGLSHETTAGRMHRRQSAAYTLAIEVRAKGRYVVHPAVNAAMDALTMGEARESLRVGNWPDVQAPLLAS